MKKFLLFIFILFLLLFITKEINAKRGCCSWHGGVCGCDTSIGRQICCDGTYSPSCTCAYIPDISIKRLPPKFTTDITAKLNFYANENGTWNIKMMLLDDNPTKYSAVINKCAGCDPGPLVDFYSNHFTFNNIYPGKWYVNVKKEIDGYWSNVIYWTIDVPEWQKPTPTPTLALLTNSITEYSTENFSDSIPIIIIIILTSLLILKLIFRFIRKKINKSNVKES